MDIDFPITVCEGIKEPLTQRTRNTMISTSDTRFFNDYAGNHALKY